MTDTLTMNGWRHLGAEIRKARVIEQENLQKLQRLVVLLLAFAVMSLFLMISNLLGY